MLNQSALKIPTITVLATLAGILVVAFACYLPILKGEFLLWDDDVHLVENTQVRGLDAEHLKEMFTATINGVYIPLTTLSFAIEYYFFGYNPFVYHLDNVLGHLVVVMLVFALGARLGLTMLGAGIAALLFGVHPMHVESVAWVTERKDVLYAVFYMAALVSYLRYLRGKKYSWFLFSMGLGLLSMLAKPMALSLPLIFLLLDWWEKRPWDWRILTEKIPLCIFIAVLGWITYTAHARIPGEGLAQGILVLSWTFIFYLRQFIFPIFSVAIFRLPQPVLWSNPEYLLSLIALIFLVIAVIRWQRHRWFAFAVLFYFLSIFFLLRLDAMKDTNVVADRFMYLPSIGFSVLLGYGVEQWWRKWNKKVLSRGLLIFGLTFAMTIISLKTFRQCYVWQDTISLWRHQLKYFPNEPIALNNLATALGKTKEFKDAQQRYRQIMSLNLADIQQGLSKKAVESVRRIDYLRHLYQIAIQADSDFKDAHYNLGKLYDALGRYPEAVAAYQAALAVDPSFKDVHVGLGDLYVNIADAPNAIYAYDQAIRLHPKDEDLYINVVRAYTQAIAQNPAPLYVDARASVLRRYAALIHSEYPCARSYFNLGLSYAMTGDREMAKVAYRRALEINPQHGAALYNLGNTYKDEGQLAAALVFYQKAIAANSRLSDAYVNMGIIYGRQGLEDLARKYYQKALKVDPSNSKTYFNLGFIEETSGRFSSAVDLYLKAVALDPENAEGYYNLANTYAKWDRPKEAISAYLKAIGQSPQHANALANLSILSFRLGDFESAVKYCDEAILAGYNAPQEYLNTLAPYRGHDHGTDG